MIDSHAIQELSQNEIVVLETLQSLCDSHPELIHEFNAIIHVAAKALQDFRSAIATRSNSDLSNASRRLNRVPRMVVAALNSKTKTEGRQQ